MRTADLSYEEALAWILGQVGSRVAVRVGTATGLPISVSFGLLQRGIDPRQVLSGDPVVEVSGEVLVLGVGDLGAYTIFSIAEERFTAARRASAGDREVLTIGQDAVFVTIGPEDMDLGSPDL